jgi:hypothetical protein
VPHEFIRILDLYDTVEEEVEMPDGSKAKTYVEKKIKSGVKKRWTCRNLEDITDYEEQTTEKGRVNKKITLLNHRYKGFIYVMCPYDEVKELLKENGKKQVYGFKKEF